jgi:hypothetical protein
VAVLGPQTVLDLLVAPLKDAAAAAAAAAQTNGVVQWQAMEAAYFCIRALAGEGLPPCNKLLLEVRGLPSVCAVVPCQSSSTQSQDRRGSYSV